MARARSIVRTKRAASRSTLGENLAPDRSRRRSRPVNPSYATRPIPIEDIARGSFNRLYPAQLSPLPLFNSAGAGYNPLC
jgi:hypothetical protein